MRTKFNLVDYKLEKLGMAQGSYMVNRSRYEWFSLEDVEHGDNTRWNELVSHYPQLSGVMESAKVERDYIRGPRFMARYRVSRDDLKKIYKVWIGYEPRYGAYTCSIGPYDPDFTGVKNNPEQYHAAFEGNRFSYHPYRRASSMAERAVTTGEIDPATGKKKVIRTNAVRLTALNLMNSDKALAKWKELLDFSDFAFKSPRCTGVEIDRTGKANDKLEYETFYSLADDDPSYQLMQQTMPLTGENASVTLNGKGMQKLLRHDAQSNGWLSVYEYAIGVVARKNNIPPERVEEIMSHGDPKEALALARKVNQYSVKRMNQLQADGDPDYVGKVIPSFTTIGLSSCGAQRSGSIRINPVQRSMALVKKLILEIIVSKGTDNPEEVLRSFMALPANVKNPALGRRGVSAFETNPDRINALSQYITRRIAQDKIRPDENGNNIEVGYDILLQEATDQYNEILSGRLGFDSFFEALQMASNYFAGCDSEDARLGNLPIETPPVFTLPEGANNYTSQQLGEWKQRGAQLNEEEHVTEEELAKRITVEKLDVDLSGNLYKPDDIERETPEDEEEGVDTDFAVTEGPTTETPSTPSTEEPITETTEQVVSQPQVVTPETQESTTDQTDVSHHEEYEDENGEDDIEKIDEEYQKMLRRVNQSSTLENLIKIAKDLDDEGKCKESEEIHKVLRKYIKD